jgi:hypothetical protein
MALGVLWFARLPVNSAAWPAAIEAPATLIPPVDVVIDVLPYSLLFGLGISFVVAPLTSTLMGSIPGRHSSMGSAINNAISRVGQPLLGAMLVAIGATAYARSDRRRTSTGSGLRRASSHSTRPPPVRPRSRSRHRTWRPSTPSTWR